VPELRGQFTPEYAILGRPAERLQKGDSIINKFSISIDDAKQEIIRSYPEFIGDEKAIKDFFVGQIEAVFNTSTVDNFIIIESQKPEEEFENTFVKFYKKF